MRRRERVCCFVPTVRVTMADGTLRPLGEVRVGEQVLSWDMAHGQSAAEKNKQLHM